MKWEFALPMRPKQWSQCWASVSASARETVVVFWEPSRGEDAGAWGIGRLLTRVKLM
ncbi:hypothetical protein JCM7447_15140 [Corynebacterium amycolatum]